jgi:hypothetical protein
MHRRVLLVALSYLVPSHYAYADGVFWDAGARCTRTATSVAPSGINGVYFDMQRGITNSAGSYGYTGEIICPVSWSQVYNGSSEPIRLFGATKVIYRDGNYTEGALGSLSCTNVATEPNGTLHVGATRHSCSTSGGCIAAATYTSPSYLGGASESYLMVSPPSIPNSFFSYSVVCSLPSNYSAYFYSSILGYNLDVVDYYE